MGRLWLGLGSGPHVVVGYSQECGLVSVFSCGRLFYIQGGPAKVKPLTFLLVTFECVGKIQ